MLPERSTSSSTVGICGSKDTCRSLQPITPEPAPPAPVAGELALPNAPPVGGPEEPAACVPPPPGAAAPAPAPDPAWFAALLPLAQPSSPQHADNTRAPVASPHPAETDWRLRCI